MGTYGSVLLLLLTTVSIVFGGDIDFSRLIRYNHVTRNCSYIHAMESLEKYFRSADYTMLNLETTVGEQNETCHKNVNNNALVGLWSDETILPALKEVGVDILTLANNHITDYRDQGTKKTNELVKKYGILPSGVVFGSNPLTRQKPVILEKNGVKIGILSYCDLNMCHQSWEGLKSGPALLDASIAITDVKELREKEGCNVVIIFLHWGKEYSNVIKPGQIGILRNLTRNSKIDLIVGSHPHVTQKHFYSKKTLIVPSIGNLLFNPYGLANFNFNEPPQKGGHNHEDFPIYEKIWFKQMQVIDDEPRHGRLLNIVFDKNGIVARKSAYLGTEVIATEQHCVIVQKGKHSEWVHICGKDDSQCTGTPNCNYIECDHDETLPKKLPDSPRIKILTTKQLLL